MTTTRKPISRRIAKARKEAGLSMYAAAKAANIPQRTWVSYERDGTEPTLSRAAQIAGVLGISLDWLAGRDD